MAGQRGAGRSINARPPIRAVATRLNVHKDFGRRPLRLYRVFDPGPLYFVTFCTHQRRPFLARDEVHAAFICYGKRAERDFNVAVGRYVIMLDHVPSVRSWRTKFQIGPLGRSPETSPGKGSQVITSKTTGLGGRIFRSRFTKRRKLRAKMELRSRKPGTRWTCEISGRLALSRRDRVYRSRVICCSHRLVAGPSARCLSHQEDGPQGRGYSATVLFKSV
jgi:hypothetical protein